MRPGVGQADHHPRISHHFLQQRRIEIQGGHGKAGPQLVGQGTVKKGIQGIFALALAQLGNRLPQPVAVLGLFDDTHLNALPLAAERLGTAGVGPTKSRPEGRIGINCGLLVGRAVEQLVTHLVRPQNKRVAQVELDLGRLAAGLGNRPTPNEGSGLIQQLTMGGGLIVAGLDRQPGDRALAFGQQKVNHIQLFLGNDGRTGPTQINLNRPIAEVSQDVGIAGQLVTAGQPAGQRTALVADVLGGQGGREAERTCLHALAQQCADLVRFVGGGRPLLGVFADHVGAQRRQSHEKAHIDPDPVPGRHPHVLGETLPAPAHAFGQHVVGHALNVDQIPGQGFVLLRPTRGKANAAVAHHHTGHAVPGRTADPGVPADLSVVVGVGVNKAGGDHQPVGINGLGCSVEMVSKLHNPTVRNGHIGPELWRAGAVNHRTVLNHEVVCHGCLRVVSAFPMQ